MFNWFKAGSEQAGKTSQAPNRRRFHLGLDWGTSSTKMVLRDLDQRSEDSAAYVLTPEGCEGGYRYPSLVAIQNNRLCLGNVANRLAADSAVILPSLKSRVPNKEFLYPQAPWGGLCERDLATLFLAHVIHLGKAAAGDLARRVGSEPLLSLTLGVPVAELEQQYIWRLYFKMIRLARTLALDMDVDPQGEKLDEALTALKSAERIDIERQAGRALPEDLHLQYLRPEVAAAMYWSMRSSVIETGLYSCVDIGAWTTNASFFRLADRRLETGELLRKDKFSFYGGKCEAPGMDSVCQQLSMAIGEKDFTKIRGREAALLKERVPESTVQLSVKHFRGTWRSAFHVSYPKENRQGPWSELKVMVIGGGAKVPLFKKIFLDFPIPSWEPPRMVPDLGVPSDLYDYPTSGVRADKSFSGDCTFALVAYGLSIPHREFPLVVLRDMVPAWNAAGPRSRVIDHEDYYTK